MTNRAPEQTEAATVNRLGFLVHTLELVNHFGCVWDLLPQGGFDVITFGKELETEKTAFSKWKCNVYSSEEVIQAGFRYQYLVSNHPVHFGKDPLIKKIAISNIRFMYAAGKSGWNLSGWNDWYNLIMCFGPHHANILAANTKAEILQMGYPRFDRYFTSPPRLHTLQRTYCCDPGKKTVVWLPTWKALSSVGHFDREISSLTQQYNVVVKLHPLMHEDEPERIEALAKHRFTRIITDTSDNLPLYQLADFMLFDYGGPPFAGIYTDKNFLLLNVPGAETDKLTGNDSPDILLREHFVSIDADEGRLSDLLADASIWEAQRNARSSLRRDFFAPHFGFASHVAANALLNLKYILRTNEEANDHVPD